jgi:hypothetical protein
MAIYGIGAYYDEDVSMQFIAANIVGIGWSEMDAPDLHQFMRSLKVGDIVYIKAFPPGDELTIKAIGVIGDSLIRSGNDTNGLVSCGRNIRWISTENFVLRLPIQKNNVRANTLYEEFHPEIQREILRRIFCLGM